MKLFRTNTLSTALLFILLSGCAGSENIIHLYDGPQKKVDALTEFSYFEAEVLVISLDGKEVPPDSDFWSLVSYFYIPPGHHKITTRLHWNYTAGMVSSYKVSKDTKDFCFTSEAGKKYRARAKLVGKDDWKPTLFEGDREVKNEC